MPSWAAECPAPRLARGRGSVGVVEVGLQCLPGKSPRAPCKKPSVAVLGLLASQSSPGLEYNQFLKNWIPRASCEAITGSGRGGTSGPRPAAPSGSGS